MTSQIAISIVNGKIANAKTVRAAFDSLEDGRYSLKFETINKRSLPQNSYYWSAVVPIVKDGLRANGFNDVKTNGDAHMVLKHLFLKRHIKSEISDELIVVETSTTELNKEGFNIYLEDIYQWASTYLGIVIPQPNEQISLL